MESGTPSPSLVRSATSSYDYVYNHVKDKIPVRPLFIIKYGPPASGKNTCINLLREHLTGLDQGSTVDADLDVIISQIPGFQNDSVQMSKQDAYQKWRSLGMEMMDDLIRQATLIPCHITFETTGSSIDWTVPLIKQMISLGYRIVIMYPLVQVDKLIQRAKIRQQQTGQVAAPTHSVQVNNRTILGITEMNQLATQNLRILIPYVDELFLIDNNSDQDVARIILHIRNVSGGTKSEQKHIPGTIKSVKCSGATKTEWYDKYIKQLLIKNCSARS